MICEYICCCGIYISEDQMKTLVVVKNVTWYEFERDERREREEDLIKRLLCFVELSFFIFVFHDAENFKFERTKTLFIIPHNTFCLSSSVINNKKKRNERTRHISSQLWLLFASIFSGRVLVS